MLLTRATKRSHGQAGYYIWRNYRLLTKSPAIKSASLHTLLMLSLHFIEYTRTKCRFTPPICYAWARAQYYDENLFTIQMRPIMWLISYSCLNLITLSCCIITIFALDIPDFAWFWRWAPCASFKFTTRRDTDLMLERRESIHDCAYFQ